MRMGTALSGSNGSSLLRRRGTRSSSSRMILNQKSLMVLLALILSIFAMGLMLGAHMVHSGSPPNTDGPPAPTEAELDKLVSLSAEDAAVHKNRVKLRGNLKPNDGHFNPHHHIDDDDGKAGGDDAPKPDDAPKSGKDNTSSTDQNEQNPNPMDDPETEAEAVAEAGNRSEGDQLKGGDEQKENQFDALEEELEEEELKQRLEDQMQRLKNPNLLHRSSEKDEKTEASKELHFGAAVPVAWKLELSEEESDYPYLLDSASADLDISNYVPLGGERFQEWKEGDTPYKISKSLVQKSDEVARLRRSHVKAAMQHAWRGYKDYAFGSDEVLPVTGRKSNNWGQLGTTLVDSLDTLWLMGMKDEFWECRDWVRDKLDHDHLVDVSVFETTIRSLGGLLSAYDWSGDKSFLDKAEDLGSKMFPAFDSPSGIPFGHINIKTAHATNAGWTGGSAILSEFTTLQLEYRFLGRATGKKEYALKSEDVYKVLKTIEPANGLYPYFVNNRGGVPYFGNNKVSFGAMGDSLYEYMLKIWLQGGKTEPLYREMYDRSMQGMHDELLQKSSPSGLVYIADKNGGRLDHKMDHLVCFMGGLLALGAYNDPLGLDSTRAQRDLKTAKALTYTCYQMYARMPTGIAPEYVQFSGHDFTVGRAPYYILRPEAVESFFILNYLTGDPVYREWGWEVFKSIEKYCKTKIAYGSVHDVTVTDAPPEDRMESFFLAETMKYIFLLMDPDTEVDIMNKHVFNTEAHPLRIFPVLDKEKYSGVTAQQ